MLSYAVPSLWDDSSSLDLTSTIEMDTSSYDEPSGDCYLHESDTTTGTNEGFFPSSLRWKVPILAFLFLSALAVRLYNFDEYPMDFHPTRQYRSALIARAFFIGSSPSVAEWERELVEANRGDVGILEPPIVEWATALAYLSVGREVLWIPRLLSILFWLSGGVFLYLTALQLGSFDAAAIGTAFYLFLPFGIEASRSFQPDPLMIMFLIAALYAMVLHHDVPTRRRLLLLATISALTVLAKPISLFVLFGAFVGLELQRLGLHQLLVSKRVWFFVVATILPGILYYGYGIFVGEALYWQAQGTFIPSLVFDPTVWQFWLKHIYRVIGFSALLAAALGVVLVRARWQRAFLIGLWTGYLVYGLVFAYHIHTHDYYQLPFIPIIALSLGAFGAAVFQATGQKGLNLPRRVAVFGILIAAIALNIGLFMRSQQELPDFEGDVIAHVRVGELVKHSTQTVVLAPHYGFPLRYHGKIAGETWPTMGDMHAMKLAGMPELSAQDRFQHVSSYHYFIITDFAELAVQEELEMILRENFTLIASTENYLIFDLQEEAGASR
jgi:4-amino-4-deoxy-L-arabinose transferase-like glycosyltransferase